MWPAQRLVSRFVKLLFVSIYLNACVSVELNKSQPITRNENVSFAKPTKPFVELKASDLDHGWRNPQNGNSISFITECSPDVDPTLENIYSGIIKGVNNAESVSKNKITYNGREALRALVTGDVDGVGSKIDFLIFKKNGCTYVITYVALAATFDQNVSDFQKFVDGFRAP
jgi:hypothetical protein